MNAHTPGPWKAALPIGNPPFVSNEGTVVVQKVGPIGDYATAEANARLIAAAPELLEALKLLQTALTEHGLRDVKKRFSLCVADAAASEALAKAEGRDT